jgi:nicotinate-nucleotide adenylyltransferase
MLLFGGSFNPIHHGHLIVARAVAESLGVARTILLPSAVPPHKQKAALAPAADRLAMCRLAIEGDPTFEVSDWELRQSGPSYSLHTVRHFRATLPNDTKLFWLIGMDTLAELATWHKIAELTQLVTFVTAARPGYSLPPLADLESLIGGAALANIRAHVLATPKVGISASDVRARVASGRSVRYLVPDAVVKTIRERRLYTSETPVVAKNEDHSAGRR